MGSEWNETDQTWVDNPLAQAVADIAKDGFPVEELELLVMLAEAYFRPLKNFELELEKLLPEFFAVERYNEPQVVLRSQFELLYGQKERESGVKWVLAAGGVPLSVGGRPPLIAPKVVGAVVAQRLLPEMKDLTEKVVLTDNAILHALERGALIATTLQHRLVRPEEVRLWRELCNRIVVPTQTGKVALARYLAYLPNMVEDLRHIGIPYLAASSPSSLLGLSIFPTFACVAFAKLIPQVERQSRKGQPPQQRKTQSARRAEKTTLFLCRLCKAGEEVNPNEIFEHLNLDHGVQPEDMILDEGDQISEIRNKSTGKLIATARRIRTTS